MFLGTSGGTFVLRIEGFLPWYQILGGTEGFLIAGSSCTILLKEFFDVSL